jgi:GntR family transcriptional regulator, transcriptional repressor for pyruvate dehydrogenase complex
VSSTRRSTEFKPLPRSTFAADAVSTIKDMILDGQLEPGQRLPSERALSEALGVSRPTVREALRSLEAMNILESRQGAGTFVSSLSAEELLRPLQFALALADSALENLFEVRLMLEPGAAALAAERATEEQLDGLRDVARRTGECGGAPEQMLRLDTELHERTVEAAANPLLEHLVASTAVMAYESRSYTVRLPGVVERTVREHREIVKAICARDPEAARAAMATHIARIRDVALAAAAPTGGRRPRPTRSRAAAPSRQAASPPRAAIARSRRPAAR